MSLNVVCGATPIVIPDGSYKYRNSIVRFNGSYEHRNSIFRVRPILADKVVFYAKLSEVQKWTLFAPSVFYIIFELPCTSVESYGRLYVKTSISFFSYCTETTRTTCDARYRYQVPGISLRTVVDLIF